MSIPKPHIHLEMQSNAQYLSGARELAGSVAKRLGFTDAQCSQIALAVDEALCNIIRHGYDRKPDELMWLNIWPVDESGNEDRGPDPFGMKIVIEDVAKQVDPEVIKSRCLDDIRPGGLGVHIIREVMDTVSYEKREGGVGMRLTMVKHKHTNKSPGETPARGNSES